MTGKKFGLGILAIALVFGMMVISCEEDATEGKFTLENDCDVYTITGINIWDTTNDTISLTKGQTKSYTLPFGSYDFTVTVEYTGTENPAPTIANEGRLTDGFTINTAGGTKRTLRVSTNGTTFSWTYN